MTHKPASRSAADAWRVATWEGHRDAQLESALAATPAQRLAWLEEALAAAHRAGAVWSESEPREEDDR
jgi:hypothetical protein